MEPADTPAIRVRGLSKRYGAFVALREVDLAVRRGETVVLCGRSGSGKSSLIRSLNGLERADGGSIEILGVALTDERRILRHIRRLTAMVFQDFALFAHLTVLENVMFAPVHALGQPRAAAVAAAMALLERVRLADQAHKYPREISGGQKQRAAIARALAVDPEIILFDEPTSALDPEMVAEVLEVMRSLARDGRTLLVVTHEMGFAREAASRIVFMDQGRIVEDRPCAEFFAAPATPQARAFLATLL